MALTADTKPALHPDVGYNVVVLIEATASLIPHIDSLRTDYIAPLLRQFLRQPENVG